MKSKIVTKILAETPKDVKIFTSKYAEFLVKFSKKETKKKEK